MQAIHIAVHLVVDAAECSTRPQQEAWRRVFARPVQPIILSNRNTVTPIHPSAGLVDPIPAVTTNHVEGLWMGMNRMIGAWTAM